MEPALYLGPSPMISRTLYRARGLIPQCINSYRFEGRRGGELASLTIKPLRGAIWSRRVGGRTLEFSGRVRVVGSMLRSQNSLSGY